MGPIIHTIAFSKLPVTIVCPNHRKGFMAAPAIGPDQRMSTVTVKPINNAPTFGALVSTADSKITQTKKKVEIASMSVLMVGLTSFSAGVQFLLTSDAVVGAQIPAITAPAVAPGQLTPHAAQVQDRKNFHIDKRKRSDELRDQSI